MALGESCKVSASCLVEERRLLSQCLSFEGDDMLLRVEASHKPLHSDRLHLHLQTLRHQNLHHSLLAHSYDSHPRLGRWRQVGQMHAVEPPEPQRRCDLEHKHVPSAGLATELEGQKEELVPFLPRTLGPSVHPHLVVESF